MKCSFVQKPLGKLVDNIFHEVLERDTVENFSKPRGKSFGIWDFLFGMEQKRMDPKFTSLLVDSWYAEEGVSL